jgi:prepilin-type processing-associated H-X9-DG protein
MRTTIRGGRRIGYQSARVAVSAQAYVSEYRGSFPIAYYFENDGSGNYSFCWDLTSISIPGQPTKVVPGILWGSNKGTAAIQQCPSFEGASNWDVDPYTGYNYNTSYLGHGQFEHFVAPAKTTAMFGDGEHGAGANKFMRAPFDSEGDPTFDGRWGGTQGYRHRGMTNVSSCDGHAESLRDRFTNTDDYNGAANIAPNTGFLSPDNRMYGGN